MAKFLKTLDIVMTVIFSLEVILKVIATGLVFNGKNSYLRDGWNLLDFMIVFSSLMSLSPETFGDISFLKALRFARILRPLRSIKRHKGLKLAVISLFKSIPEIARMFMVVVFVLLILGVLMTTIYSGSFYRC